MKERLDRQQLGIHSDFFCFFSLRFLISLYLDFFTPLDLSLSIALLEFTGISAPYEAPEKPEIHIKAGTTSVEDSVKIITQYLIEKDLLKL